MKNQAGLRSEIATTRLRSEPRVKKAQPLKSATAAEDSKYCKSQLSQNLQKTIQKVSNLYIDHLYGNNEGHFVADRKAIHLQELYENERKIRNDIYFELEQSRSDIEKLEGEKKVLTFALRAMEIRLRDLTKPGPTPSSQGINPDDKENEPLSTVNKNRRTDFNQGRKLRIKDCRFAKRRESEMRSLKTPPVPLEDSIFVNLLLGKNSEPDLKRDSKSDISRDSEASISLEVQKDSHKNPEAQVKDHGTGYGELLFEQICEKLASLEIRNNQLSGDQKKLEATHTEAINQLELMKLQNTSLRNELASCQLTSQQQQRKIIQLEFDMKVMTGRNHDLNEKVVEFEQLRKEQDEIIEELQKKNYAFLRKQQKEMKDIEMLKKFTEELQLNDKKIKEFIETEFGDQIDQNCKSQKKSYREEISYLLHLCKKKQVVFENLFNDYRNKLRVSQTRCYVAEKRLYEIDKVHETLTRQLRKVMATEAHQTTCEEAKKLHEMMFSYFGEPSCRVRENETQQLSK